MVRSRLPARRTVPPVFRAETAVVVWVAKKVMARAGAYRSLKTMVAMDPKAADLKDLKDREDRNQFPAG
jgi:hypothetical protein